MRSFEALEESLIQRPKKWLITGVAGFIGSNILERLLSMNQVIVGLDNFSTGYKSNLNEVQSITSRESWARFNLIGGDIKDIEICMEATKDVDYVLHQAALGSVPRSIHDPINSNMSNVSGFLNMLTAAKENNVESFTYASSSSAYGDHPALPKKEEIVGEPLSPYALTKVINEKYAKVFSKCYGFKSIGLRYFNVFGKRQNINGPYAAVIPKWATKIINTEQVEIYGDGSTSRDFCFVENVIQANILSAVAEDSAKNEIYNIALGERTSLTQLYCYIEESLSKLGYETEHVPLYQDFRPGDVLHSEADISKAMSKLSFKPQVRIKSGIELCMPWFVENTKISKDSSLA